MDGWGRGEFLRENYFSTRPSRDLEIESMKILGSPSCCYLRQRQDPKREVVWNSIQFKPFELKKPNYGHLKQRNKTQTLAK